MKMSIIIDRRKNSKNVSLSNRERFLARHRAEIKQKILKSIKSSDVITKQNKDITIDNISTHEPTFNVDHGTGVSDFILPGNEEFMTGDRIPKEGPKQGQGGSQAGNGSGEDDFIFTLTEDEYLDILFDGLELPNIQKLCTNGSDLVERQRAGFQNSGSNLDLIATFKKSITRRAALKAPLLKRLDELEGLYEQCPSQELMEAIEDIKRRIKTVCFIDDVDVKFRRSENKPKPMSKVVMFFVLDVSGSVDENGKDMAKRYFLLTYLFLKRLYAKHEIVFITFTNEALEVDEEEFFHGRRSGGTEFSSALKLQLKIIEERYPEEEWNIYTTMASDSDNSFHDMEISEKFFKSLISINQMFTYCHLDTAGGDFDKAKLLKGKFKNNEKFHFARLTSTADALSEFKRIFSQKSK